jgi:hypothetical protein
LGFTDGALPCPIPQFGVGRGRRHVDEGAQFVEGDLALAERVQQMRQIPGPLSDMGIGPLCRGCDAEALDGPRLR